MRHALMLAVVAAFSLPVHAAGPTEVVSAFHQALARGDERAATALLSPQVEIYESGYVEHARDEYARHHLHEDIQFAKATTERVVHSSERIEGKLAVVMRETETSGTYHGRNAHSFGTESAVLERQGEDWLIVHVHWSSRKDK